MIALSSTKKYGHLTMENSRKSLGFEHKFQLISWELVWWRIKKLVCFVAGQKNSFRGNSFRGWLQELVSWQLVSWWVKKTRFVAGWKNSFRGR